MRATSSSTAQLLLPSGEIFISMNLWVLGIGRAGRQAQDDVDKAEHIIILFFVCCVDACPTQGMHISRLLVQHILEEYPLCLHTVRVHTCFTKHRAVVLRQGCHCFFTISICLLRPQLEDAIEVAWTTSELQLANRPSRQLMRLSIICARVCSEKAAPFITSVEAISQV